MLRDREQKLIHRLYLIPIILLDKHIHESFYKLTASIFYKKRTTMLMMKKLTGKNEVLSITDYQSLITSGFLIKL